MTKPINEIIDELISQLEEIKKYYPAPETAIIDLQVSGYHIVCDIDSLSITADQDALRFIGMGDVVGHPLGSYSRIDFVSKYC